MYEYSRQIYRELAPELAPPLGMSRRDAQRLLLSSGEYVVERLREDPWLLDRLRRTLFAEIRPLFAIETQPYVLEVITLSLRSGRALAERLPSGPVDADGQPLHCSHITRAGTPCERTPGADGVCPSHRYYGDAFRREEDGAEVAVARAA